MVPGLIFIFLKVRNLPGRRAGPVPRLNEGGRPPSQAYSLFQQEDVEHDELNEMRDTILVSCSRR